MICTIRQKGGCSVDKCVALSADPRWILAVEHLLGIGSDSYAGNDGDWTHEWRDFDSCTRDICPTLSAILSWRTSALYHLTTRQASSFHV